MTTSSPQRGGNRALALSLPVPLPSAGRHLRQASPWSPALPSHRKEADSSHRLQPHPYQNVMLLSFLTPYCLTGQALRLAGCQCLWQQPKAYAYNAASALKRSPRGLLCCCWFGFLLKPSLFLPLENDFEQQSDSGKKQVANYFTPPAL